jgi:hypothetical protein
VEAWREFLRRRKGSWRRQSTCGYSQSEYNRGGKKRVLPFFFLHSFRPSYVPALPGHEPVFEPSINIYRDARVTVEADRAARRSTMAYSLGERRGDQSVDGSYPGYAEGCRARSCGGSQDKTRGGRDGGHSRWKKKHERTCPKQKGKGKAGKT